MSANDFLIFYLLIVKLSAERRGSESGYHRMLICQLVL